MPEGYPDGCIHELIERQAAAHPDAPALYFAGETVTFGELEARANRMANYLRRRGVGPEAFVGLKMERSADSAAALIGILKSGAAYLYLDPSWPEARLREMIADARPAMILDGVPDPGNESGVSPGPEAGPDSAAYLIYTSGSTGKPRGVIAVHRSITSRLISVPLPDIRPGDLCCLNSSHSFGISASRLFLPLAQGIPVLILREEDVRDTSRFVDKLREYGVTSVFMVPALLRQVLAMSDRELPRLRAVAVSGGALTPEIADAFFTAFPEALLVNVYGGSEIGTAACMKVMDAASIRRPISLGPAVANTRVHLIGGEICVEARHLARGYLNDPGLTVQRFVEAPGGGRMYRTGDLGRELPDGEIEFLGRADHQVKVRGFRIELGEIEAALDGERCLRESTATVYEVNGENRLVAFVVYREGAERDVRALRARLGERLPGNMIPGMIIAVAELPRTNNGKVDRAGLPRPEECGAREVFEEPRTETERALAGMWEEIFGVRPIGRQDHFMDLGGDSLTATETIARVWTRFGVRMGFAAVFEHATVEELAKVIDIPDGP